MEDIWTTWQKNTKQGTKKGARELSSNKTNPDLVMEEAVLQKPGLVDLNSRNSNGNKTTSERELAQRESFSWPWFGEKCDSLNREQDLRT
jgi:hypothetical protein